jgi:ER lumen protein retaining receptor
MSFVLWLFEIGYILQHLATISQIWKIQQKNNTEMISLETNVLFLIGAFSRLIWMWDSMLKGFFLSYVEIVLALGTLAYFIYLYNKYKMNNYYAHEIKTPFYLQLFVLIPVILLLSFFFHPGSKGKYYLTMQMFVSLSIFAEAIGLLPQLYLIRKSNDTGDLSQLYVVFLGFARLFRLLFWLKMYFDGNKFMSLIFADLVHCLLLFNFIYSVIKNWSGKGLPTSLSGGDMGDGTKKMF